MTGKSMKEKLLQRFVEGQLFVGKKNKVKWQKEHGVGVCFIQQCCLCAERKGQ